MIKILEKCEVPDFEYISDVLENYFSLTDDKKRKKHLEDLKTANGDKGELIKIIDTQIKYFGSSDLAYFWRSIFNDDGGINASEIVNDVCKKMKITIKKGGSIEAKLERLVKAIIEQEVLTKSSEDLKNEFENMGFDNQVIDEFIEHVKKGAKVAIIPIMIEIFGVKATIQIIQTIIISLIANIIGREAANIIVKEIIKRNPYLNMLGPVMWGITAGWLAIDLQGPAYRKTIPICLYLGIVGLRDGPEDKDFYDG